LLLFFVSGALAGGWTQAQGDFYGKAGYRVVLGKSGFDAQGKHAELEPYQDHAAQLYGEVGATDHWTLLLSSSPLGYTRLGDQGSPYMGPSRLGVRRSLTTGVVKTALEVQGGYTPPVGDEDLSTDPSYRWQGSVPGGSVSGEAQLGYGWGRNWLSLGAGYRWNSSLSDAVIGGLQIGRQWDHLVLDLHMPVSWSLELQEPYNMMGTGDAQYVGLGIGLGWWFNEHVGLSTSLESVAFARANAAAPTIPLFLQVR
jgi:hypothetical protein